MNNSDLQNPELSIVIPLYNERDNLIPLEDKLETELSKLNLSYEIILIDDGEITDIIARDIFKKMIYVGSQYSQ